MKAIETSYAGCRFRSRLEARWAVFFDILGVAWEYEPEGYMVGPEDEQQPYLPDFWLPGLEQWVEVKGSTPCIKDRLRMIHAVIPHWGLPNGHNGLLYLGGIPDVRHGVIPWHHLFTFHKGDLYRSPYQWGSPNVWPNEWLIISCVDAYSWSGALHVHPELGGVSVWNPSAWLVDGWMAGPSHKTTRVRRAYEAARSARFEHGEAG